MKMPISRNEMIAVLAVSIFVFVPPLIQFEPHWGVGRRMVAYGGMGAWISGVVTPLLLGVAILSFRGQTRAFEQQVNTLNRQIDAQVESNKIANRAYFSANVSSLEIHLAYRCYCAMVDNTPVNPAGEESNRSKILNTMCGKLNNDIPPQSYPDGPGAKILPLSSIRTSSHYRVLAQELSATLDLEGTTGALTVFDNRLHRIAAGIKRYPPI